VNATAFSLLTGARHVHPGIGTDRGTAPSAVLATKDAVLSRAEHAGSRWCFRILAFLSPQGAARAATDDVVLLPLEEKDIFLRTQLVARRERFDAC
jgi:hypothetical protein